MNELYNLMGQFLKMLNIDQFEGLLYTFILTILVLLYRQFNNNIEQKQMRESQEINKCLNIYASVMKLIYRYKIGDIEKQIVYMEFYNLLPICSSRLSKMILEVNIDNEDEFRILNEQVIKEYNSIRYYDKFSIHKIYSDDILEFYEYQFNANGFFKIFQTSFFSMIAVVILLVIFLIMYRYTIISTAHKVVFLILIISLMYYLVVCIVNIQIISQKRFEKNLKYIIWALLMFISPSIFYLGVNIVTSITFALFLTVYSFFIFPKAVRKISVFSK